MLRPVKGNMYTFCTHTFNTVKGKCPHDCSYCYMKRFKLNNVRLDRSEFKTNLYKDGEFKVIFLGSSCDMWANEIPRKWILETLGFLSAFTNNKYLLQTKNPDRFISFRSILNRLNYIYGTTIETNRSYKQMGKAPDTIKRATAMKEMYNSGFLTMVTIEPIMDFDLKELVELVVMCRPEWVNIGADSQGHKLPEPNRMQVTNLIDTLGKYKIPVKVKQNLKRIMT